MCLINQELLTNEIIILIKHVSQNQDYWKKNKMHFLVWIKFKKNKNN